MGTVSAWLGLALAAVGVLGLIRRYIVRPLGRWVTKLAKLAGQVDDAASIASALAELSGAITRVIVAFDGRLRELTDEISAHDDRLDALAELLTDALADVARLEKNGGK